MSDENALISKVQAGDNQSFNILINNYNVRIKNTIYQTFPQIRDSDYQDALQSSLIRIWNKVADFRGECSFYTWFFTVVKNECLTLIDKRNKKESKEIPIILLQIDEDTDEDYDGLLNKNILVESENPSKTLELKEKRLFVKKILKNSLKKLSPVHCKILKMSLYEEKSYKEIADTLNLPLGTIMSRIYYARKHAKKVILEYLYRRKIKNLDNLGLTV